MRLVIDMQGIQLSTSDSMSQTLRALFKALIRNRGEHDVVLALNGHMSDSIQPIRAEFEEYLQPQNIRIWYPPKPVKNSSSANQWRREVTQCIREAFFASLRPDAVYMTTLSEDFAEDMPLNISAFAPGLFTIAALHEIARTAEHQYTFPHKKEWVKRADLFHVLPALTAGEVCNSYGLTKDQLIASGIKLDSDSAYDQEARVLLDRISDSIVIKRNTDILETHVRPRLAYVSPLPPARSGISDYSVMLLPALADYYNIDVIVDQAEISDAWVVANCTVRSVSWFAENAETYDRVLYHFGNSQFHQHMFPLLQITPGVVVLHDFYLGDIQRFRQVHGQVKHAWTKALYQSHGYGAITEHISTKNDSALVSKYPVNFEVIAHAYGVIIHSEHAHALAQSFYGKTVAEDWQVIPLARDTPAAFERNQLRQELGLRADDFVVCSFGLLGPTKLNHRLIDAWLNSSMAKNPACVLIFVGENHSGEYGHKLQTIIRKSPNGKRVKITGWLEPLEFQHYLSIADVAVQLRSTSRGETSAAILDCMNYSLPTIVNANGSMAELPTDAVSMLRDEFTNEELKDSLESLWRDEAARIRMARNAAKYIEKNHRPRVCAKQYVDAIEHFYNYAACDSQALVEHITKLNRTGGVKAEQIQNLDLISWARAIAETLPTKQPARQLLIDVSATCRKDLKTGIQRVVRALVCELIQGSPYGYRVEPVYLSNQGGEWHYRYARIWTAQTIGINSDWAQDDSVQFTHRDTLLVADYTGYYLTNADRAGVLDNIKNLGVDMRFLVYDLLPIQMPHMFPPAQLGFEDWLNVVFRVADKVICISEDVAQHLQDRALNSEPARLKPLVIDWFHLGADVENSAPTYGIPEEADQFFSCIAGTPTFLMVGTIEPRKGYLQVLQAFNLLWQSGLEINLVIIGNEGWQGLPDNMRRTIPETIDSLRRHPDLNKRLFWLKGVSDEYLNIIYKKASCLIAASEGEGFGLPLIEAAQHKLPIIARDIGVFREVAGDHAFYFSGLNAEALSEGIKNWLHLYHQGKHPVSDGMPWLTWEQSAQQLLGKILVQ